MNQVSNLHCMIYESMNYSMYYRAHFHHLRHKNANKLQVNRLIWIVLLSLQPETKLIGYRMIGSCSTPFGGPLAFTSKNA